MSQPDTITSEARFTDNGNAWRLAERIAGQAMFVPAWNRWLVWRDGRWQPDQFGQVVKLARALAADLYLDAVDAVSDDERRRIGRHANASNSSRGINSMVNLAANDPDLIVQPEALDRDPWVLNATNGTVDLRTGQVRAHDPRDLITRQVAAPFDPEATCPRWLQFLEEILPDTDTRGFLQRAVGYSLTGDTREQCMLILHGSGANGKSVLLESLLALLGDYGLNSPAETLLAKRGDSIPNDVAQLRGARMVVASETEDGRRLAEARVKALTGGDTVSARFMRAEWFSFRPVGKLWLGTNHRPDIRGNDHAIWRRIRLVPFEERFGPGGRPADADLAHKLRGELPGILAWAVRGTELWLRYGLNPPSNVAAATGAYREEQDRLQSFIEDRCTVDPTATATAADLFKAWCDWCETERERPGSKRGFGRRLQEAGFKQTRSMRARLWEGIGVE